MTSGKVVASVGVIIGVVTFVLLLLSSTRYGYSRGGSNIRLGKSATESWQEFIARSAQERYTTQPLDHDTFRGRAKMATFQQRYFWVQPPKAKANIIFFYAGNEASVEAYLKSCGMMWENAAHFNAALVFAEHRFWGKSQPDKQEFALAGPDQAMKDYVALLDSLIKNETNQFFDKKAKVKVVAFGGSYGGMLAAWMRLKYPRVIHLAVASSAPVLAFPDHRWGRKNGYYRDGGASYWRVVSDVYSDCSAKIHDALTSTSLISPEARSALGLCDDDLNRNITEEDVLTWIGYPLETLAMGDYHFPSDYITGRVLPARPAKLACYMFLTNPKGGLWALRDAIGVMYNVTREETCYHVPYRREASFYDGLWDQYWCRWLIPQETYFQMNGPPNDMFLPLKLDWEDIAKHCKQTLNVTPDGGRSVYKWIGAISEKDWVRKASRIVFSNGGHDPWSSGGFYSKRNPKLKPVWIPSGAHHVDLMFSRPEDPLELYEVRKEILKHIKQWLNEDKIMDIPENLGDEDEDEWNTGSDEEQESDATIAIEDNIHYETLQVA
jgi:lysosomal Pro-X carboxypeptidase